LGISLASFPDTLTPNLNNRIKNEDGLLIRVKDTLFLRDTIAKKWVNLSGSGSGSGSSSGVDSITQVGSILYVWKAGVSTPHETKTSFTFTPNYNNKLFLLYTNGVLTDSVPSGVKDGIGLRGFFVMSRFWRVRFAVRALWGCGSGEGSKENMFERTLSVLREVECCDTKWFAEIGGRDARDELTELQSNLAAALSIKPLVWVEYGKHISYARCAIGEYMICNRDGVFADSNAFEWELVLTGRKDVKGKSETLGDAKMECWLDYCGFLSQWLSEGEPHNAR